MSLSKHIQDGGYKSRKLVLVAFTEVLLVVAALAGSKYPEVLTAYPTLSGALVATCALYFSANVAAKHVLGKQVKAPEPEEPTAEESPAEPK